jgi:hypothetical protein
MSQHIYTYEVQVVGGRSFPMLTALPLHQGDIIIYEHREYRVDYIIHAVAPGVTPIACVRWLSTRGDGRAAAEPR